MELGKVKARIEKYSKENGVDVQVAWDSFFFNEFLYRLSLSRFKDKYVFKDIYFAVKHYPVYRRFIAAGAENQKADQQD